jgi:TetR/AcrR family transcriptional regulator
MAVSGTRTKRPEAVKRSRGRPARSALVGFDALLRSARTVFAKQGYEAASVREIARQAGVDPALIVHHFGSKEGLWIAVVEQLTEKSSALVDATVALSAARLSARERVKRALVLLIDVLFEDHDIGMFFSTAATEQGERLNVLLERLYRPYQEVFVSLLADAMAAGKLKARDPALMYAMTLSAISNTISYSHVLAKFSPITNHPEQFREAVLDLALEMFR